MIFTGLVLARSAIIMTVPVPNIAGIYAPGPASCNIVFPLSIGIVIIAYSTPPKNENINGRPFSKSPVYTRYVPAASHIPHGNQNHDGNDGHILVNKPGTNLDNDEGTKIPNKA